MDGIIFSVCSIVFKTRGWRNRCSQATQASKEGSRGKQTCKQETTSAVQPVGLQASLQLRKSRAYRKGTVTCGYRQKNGAAKGHGRRGQNLSQECQESC
eukprot:1315814-Pleurochrysis_carterae.AAC.1